MLPDVPLCANAGFSAANEKSISAQNSAARRPGRPLPSSWIAIPIPSWKLRRVDKESLNAARYTSGAKKGIVPSATNYTSGCSLPDVPICRANFLDRERYADGLCRVYFTANTQMTPPSGTSGKLPGEAPS